MPQALRKLVARTLFVPVIVLVALSIALGVWVARLIRAEGMVRHTIDVISRLNESERLLIDQETGLRAWLLSADPTFLAPYYEGKRRFPPTMNELTRLTADNPAQSRRLDDVRKAYAAWMVASEAELGRREPSRGDAPTIEHMRSRKRDMDGMRGTFNALRTDENRLLHERDALAQRANTIALGAGIVSVLIASFLLASFLRRQFAAVDRIYGQKVDESEAARHAAEAMAEEIREQATEMERVLRETNREKDEALRRLSESQGRQ
jgi:methyl-accepting chemotaxis protein